MLIAFVVASALSLVVPTGSHRHACDVSRPGMRCMTIARMCAPLDAGDLELQEAARRVIAAAKQFGIPQEEAAAAWVDDALRGRAADGSELLSQQLSLFEGCLLDGEDDGSVDRCKELDDALGALEHHLMAAATQTPAESFFAVFGKSKVDRAAARVRAAATKFGPAQGKVAAAWVAEVRRNGQVDPVRLLEAQEALFGECLLDEDGGSSRCRELSESLSALQASLGVRGSIISTRDLLPKPEAR